MDNDMGDLNVTNNAAGSQSEFGTATTISFPAAQSSEYDCHIDVTTVNDTELDINTGDVLSGSIQPKAKIPKKKNEVPKLNNNLHNIIMSVKSDLLKNVSLTSISDITPSMIAERSQIKKKDLAQDLLSIIAVFDESSCKVQAPNVCDAEYLTTTQEVKQLVQNELLSTITTPSEDYGKCLNQITSLTKTMKETKTLISNLESYVKNYTSECKESSIHTTPIIAIPKTEIHNPTPHLEQVLDDFIPTSLSDTITAYLDNECAFVQHNGHATAVFGEQYTYIGTKHITQPPPMPDHVSQVAEMINKLCPDHQVTSCLINKFVGPESYLPEHSDNERSLDPESKIYTVSLGDSRVINFREIHSNNTHSHIAAHNSLYSMSRESQNFWHHQIEKDAEFHGTRYSLTFRCVSWIYSKSVAIVGDSNTKPYVFGNGPKTFGASTPGKRIRAGIVSEINAFADNISSYSNIIIQCGLNDIRYQPVSQGKMKQLISTIEDRCLNLQSLNNRQKIFISPILPTRDPLINHRARYMNGLIRELCAKYYNVTMLDCSSLVDSTQRLRSNLCSDQVHLKDNGIGVMVKIIKQYVHNNHSKIEIVKNVGYHSSAVRNSDCRAYRTTYD